MIASQRGSGSSKTGILDDLGHKHAHNLAFRNWFLTMVRDLGKQYRSMQLQVALAFHKLASRKTNMEPEN